MKECLKCHKEFIPSHKYIRALQIFCSKECRENQLTSICETCKKEFNWDKHGKLIRKYCSDPCSRIGSRNRTTINCKHCKKNFEVRASRLKYVSVQFCSKSCLSAYRKPFNKTRKEIVKQNNERSYLRKKVWAENKKYDGNLHITENDTCAMCNSQKILVIHHSDGNNGEMGKALNNDEENLVILCKSCHPKVHNRWWLKDWRQLS